MPPLMPKYVDGVVVMLIPEHTPPEVETAARRAASQMAYDYSEHPEDWQKRYYEKHGHKPFKKSKKSPKKVL